MPSNCRPHCPWRPRSGSLGDWNVYMCILIAWSCECMVWYDEACAVKQFSTPTTMKDIPSNYQPTSPIKRQFTVKLKQLNLVLISLTPTLQRQSFYRQMPLSNSLDLQMAWDILHREEGRGGSLHRGACILTVWRVELTQGN